MNAQPELRRRLHFVPQTQNDAISYIVKDPVSLKYYKFGEKETLLMRLMDGRRSLDDIVRAVETEHGIVTSSDAVDGFVRKLKQLGLVERTQEERSALLMEFVRHDRRVRLKGHGGNILRMRFSLGDPDVLLTRMHHALGILFTPAFIAASVGLFAVYALVVATHWPTFTSGLEQLYTPERYTAGFVITLYLTTLVIFLVHEFGHGLTCKHFGGEVHELGVMLIYFMPAFYCNVNDAWTFEKRAQRLWVTFAGGWIQLVLASLAALVWLVAQPGTVPHDVAFIALLIGGGLTVLINFNPLIPLDGYYALVDWLGMPNLRARAFEYIGARLKQLLLRTQLALPKVSRREARIFTLYGALSLLYTALILGVFAVGIGRFMTEKWAAWGLALFILLFWRATRRLRHKLHAALATSGLGLRLRASRRRLLRPLAFAIVIAAALFLIPWTIRVSGVAAVEAQQRVLLRPPEPARVERVLVQEGDVVRAGQALAVLQNPELELDWTRAQAAVSVLEREVEIARLQGQQERARLAELELLARRATLEQLRRRRAALVLRAPFAARVATPHVHELVGLYAQPGDSLLELWSLLPARARLSLAQRDAAHLNEGDAVSLKFPVQPTWTWRTRVAQLAPAAQAGRVEVIVELAQPDESDTLRPGMTGVGKVAVRRTSLGSACLRAAGRFFRTDLLL